MHLKDDRVLSTFAYIDSSFLWSLHPSLFRQLLICHQSVLFNWYLCFLSNVFAKTAVMISTYVTYTYLGLFSIAVMLVSSRSFVSSRNGTCSQISSVSIFLALCFWSQNTGIPSRGTPWYTASWTLCSPHCVINNLILGWAGNLEIRV
jgi:hypothetical protein